MSDARERARKLVKAWYATQSRRVEGRDLVHLITAIAAALEDARSEGVAQGVKDENARWATPRNMSSNSTYQPDVSKNQQNVDTLSDAEIEDGNE